MCPVSTKCSAIVDVISYGVLILSCYVENATLCSLFVTCYNSCIRDYELAVVVNVIYPIIPTGVLAKKISRTESFLCMSRSTCSIHIIGLFSHHWTSGCGRFQGRVKCMKGFEVGKLIIFSNGLT